jgi:alpha-1,2-mannosyltransferase
MTRLGGATRRLARRRSLSVAVFIEAPLIFIVFYVWLVGVKGGWHMQDFGAIRSAGVAVLHGHSPYPPPDPEVLLKARQLVYPPLVAYLFVPFALLPYGVAAPLYFVLLLAALAGALLVLQVRDWRCYGIVALWYPTVACLGTGAVGPLLALLLAVGWRHRARPLVAASALSIALVAKLFLWPVGLWLLATRRWRATVFTVALASVELLVPFAPLGWGGVRSYRTLLVALDGVFGPVSFSANTLFRAFGASTALARAEVVALGVVLVVLVLVVGLRRGSDHGAFAIALAASLLLSPIVWMHYYVLLVVPIAIAQRRLGVLWFAPLLYWASPELESFGETRRLAVGIGVTVIICFLAAATRAQSGAGVDPEQATKDLTGRGPHEPVEPDSSLSEAGASG